MRFARGKKCRMWATEAHGDPKALAGAQRNIGAHGARRLDQHLGHQVTGDSDGGTALAQMGNRFGQIANVAALVRILQQGPEEGLVLNRGWIGNHQLKTKVGRPRAHHIDGLRKAAGIDEETIGFGLRHPARHGHGFGGGGRFVQQRGVGDFHAGQVQHHLLIVHQRFQAPLGNFGLVRRVGGVPARVLHDVAQNHGRGERAVIPHADEGLIHNVLIRNGTQVCQRLVLTTRRRQGQIFRQTNGCRDGLVDQCLHAGCTNDAQHGRCIRLIGADMAPDEFVILF